MGLVAAAGTLGILIPPSVTMVIYGVVTEENIGKLFMGGVIPAFYWLLFVITSAVIIAKGKLRPPAQESWDERLRKTVALPGPSCPSSSWAAFTWVSSPPLAAVLSVFYTIIVSMFVYKELKLRDMRDVFRHSIDISP